MKPLLSLCLVTAILFPAFAHADENPAATRAQVRSELIALEQVGFNPYARDWHYPLGLQGAQAAVQQRTGSDPAYGPAPATATESGNIAH